MGPDLCAGTLPRYCSHNWKAVVQQRAEENGGSFPRITPDGESAGDGEELSPAEVQAAVENRRDQILTAISQPGQPPCTPLAGGGYEQKHPAAVSAEEQQKQTVEAMEAFLAEVDFQD